MKPRHTHWLEPNMGMKVEKLRTVAVAMVEKGMEAGAGWCCDKRMMCWIRGLGKAPCRALSLFFPSISVDTYIYIRINDISYDTHIHKFI